MRRPRPSRQPGPPVVEPVRQVTLAPVRPRRAWYWFGALVVVASLLGALLLLTVGAFGFLREVDELRRVEIPGSATVELPAGASTVFHEPEGGPVVPLGALDVEVRDPTSGTTVGRIGPTEGEQYRIEGRAGLEIGELSVPEAGSYELVVSGDATGQLAIGASPRRRLGRFGWRALVLAGAGVVAGGVTLVVTWRRRSAAITRRAASGAESASPGRYRAGHG